VLFQKFEESCVVVFFELDAVVFEKFVGTVGFFSVFGEDYWVGECFEVTGGFPDDIWKD